MGKLTGCHCSDFASDECAGLFQLRCECCSPQDGSALHTAAACGDTAALRRLLLEPEYASGALPLDACGSSPLHIAAAHGHADAAQLLLAHCAAAAGSEAVRLALNAVTEFGLTALHCAAANPRPGAYETLVVLAACGADPQARTEPLADELSCCAGDTALHLAAQHSFTRQAAPVVYALLSSGLNPLEPAGYLHTTPMEYACGAGDVEVVKLMLSFAAHSPRYAEFGVDAAYLLSLAVAYSATDVADFLLDPPLAFRAILTQQRLPQEPSSVLEGQASSSSSRSTSEDGSSAMPSSQVWAFVDMDEPIVQPFQLDRCLHHAIMNDDLEMARILVAAGASASLWRCNWHMLQAYNEYMDKQGWDGRFPLLHGMQADYYETPLTLALKLRHVDIATWLIKRTAASFPRIDGKNRTALHYAARLGNHQLLRWLLETGQYKLRGENGERVIEQLDYKQYSALALAIESEDSGAVELLCRNGADVSFPVNGKHGCLTTMQAALMAGNGDARSQMLWVLTQYGADVEAGDLETAVQLDLADELDFLLRSMQDGGQQLGLAEAADLLLNAVKSDRCACVEVLLAHGLDPCVSFKFRDGKRKTLLAYCFVGNRAMFLDGFQYSERQGRMGWQLGADGNWQRLCLSKTRSNGVRIMQALVLAGADAGPLVRHIEQECDGTEALRAVAAHLQKPVWIKEQHRLWPAAFKAAVEELVRGLHRQANTLTGGAAGGNGGAMEEHAVQPAPAPPLLPDSIVQRIVAQLAQLSG